MPDDEMDRPGNPTTIDATTLKGLAHPLRIELLEQLLDHGPDTASGLARRVGENSGTTSYHLRRLAKVGLIEEALDLGNARDRYWRAVSGWTLERDVIEAPETQTDARLVVEEINQRRSGRLATWLAQQHHWSGEWRDAVMLSDVRLNLTAPLAAEMGREFMAVAKRYQSRELPVGTPGTTKVIAQTNVFPIGDAISEGQPH